MLLEKLYPREDINMIFSEFDKVSASDALFVEEVVQSEKIIFDRIKGNYDNIGEEDLKEIIKFGIIYWTPYEKAEFGDLDYCERCGYCCKETSPLLIQRMESERYLNDSFFNDNIMPHGFHYQFIYDSPCKYYNESGKKCNIYDKRPINCREYPIGAAAVIVSHNCKNSIEIAIKKIEALIKECESNN